ncbi:MAG: hypothetical protein K2X66_14060, partial [Cyanobacteria bacterium]|nr:hypothetical protein [Cyanobacteriota bacterium]
LTYRDMKLLKTKKLFLPRWTQAAKRNAEKIARYETLFQKSKDLIKAHKHTQTIGEEFRKLYQPLKEALDYAYAHEVPVIVPAGNYGGHKGVEADVIGNVNPMSIINHPGLIVVGSTNSKGVISDFTSEFNDEIRPFIGGMGSDEVMSSKASVLKRAWGQKFLFPLGGILGNYLRGISMAAFSRPLWMQILGPLGGVGTQMIMGENKGGIFAAPDVTLLYLKMKEIDPSLTIEEAKSMMLQAAAKAEFSPKHLKKIETEIAQCGKTTARNYSHGLIDNVMTGVQAAVLSGKKTLRLRCEMGNIKIQRVHHHHQEHLKIRFLSYIDQERVRIELPLEGLENLQHTGYKPLLAWLQGIVKKEDSKLEKLSPDDKQKKLLQMELGRRVGNGTIAGKRYQIIAMTEQARLAKEKHRMLEHSALLSLQSPQIPQGAEVKTESGSSK